MRQLISPMRGSQPSELAGEGLVQQRLFQRRQRRLLLLVEARDALGFGGGHEVLSWDVRGCNGNAPNSDIDGNDLPVR